MGKALGPSKNPETHCFCIYREKKMQKLIVLDKDGTLVEPASGADFVQHPGDQVLLPGVAARIAELREMGAKLVIASNQGGVAAGHKSLDEAVEEMRYCLALISDECGNYAIHSGYFCPDFDGQTCYEVGAMPALDEEPSHYGRAIFNLGNYRKPSAGMLFLAMEQEVCSDAIMIGDRPEDAQAAAAAGIAFVDAQAWRSGEVKILPSGVIV